MDRIRLYIKLDDFVRISASLLCIIYVINDKMVLGFPKFDSIQRYIVRILIVLAAYMIYTAPKMLNKKTIAAFLLLLMFALITFVSAVYNRYTVPTTNPVSLVRTDFLYLICTYIILLYIAINDKFTEFITILMYYVAFICIAIDFFILTGKSFGGTSGGLIYLIGTKFTVSYTHMVLLVTYLVYIRATAKEFNRMLFGFISLVSIMITILVDCNTGTIGLLILLFLLFLQTQNRLFFYGKISYIITLFAGVIFITSYTIILSMPIVKIFISDVLKRDITLTGRTDIYGRLFYVILLKPLLGYGYGNNGRISYMFFQYANTQNGLMEWIIQIGILGVIPMIVFFVYVISLVGKTDVKKKVYPVFALIITYNCLATVEITISLTYIFFIIFLGAWCYWEDIISERSMVG